MLPANDADLRQHVMLHGLFHRIQPELGLITEDGFNEHLDTLEGRVSMQLEWRALRRAVESSGSDRAEAIADALAFRRERRARFPGAAEGERREEIREGLASYTGIAAWANSPSDAHRAAASALAGGESQTAFVGNFEAHSGPAYGVLYGQCRPIGRTQYAAVGFKASPVTGPLEGTTLQGDCWRVTLITGWVVQPAARSGSFTIVREK